MELERYKRRRPWWWVLVWPLPLLALLLGCNALPPPAYLAACAAACQPSTMAEVNGGRCVCHPPEGACSVDRLLVTPVPPPPKRGAK